MRSFQQIVLKKSYIQHSIHSIQNKKNLLLSYKHNFKTAKTRDSQSPEESYNRLCDLDAILPQRHCVEFSAHSANTFQIFYLANFPRVNNGSITL